MLSPFYKTGAFSPSRLSDNRSQRLPSFLGARREDPVGARRSAAGSGPDGTIPPPVPGTLLGLAGDAGGFAAGVGFCADVE